MRNIVVLWCLLLTGNILSQNPTWLLFDHTNAPFVNDSVNWVEVDSNNVKWIGTQNGLYSFNNNSWTVYNTQNSNIPNNRIDKFKIAFDNTIWFLNHNNGFIKFKNNTFTLYNKSNLSSLPTDSLLGLAIDSNDVFFWTDKNGVVKFNSLTNSIYNMDTTNSCLKSVQNLVFHSNHTLYGNCKNPGSSFTSPQNKADSILLANNFTIVNSNNPSINYCFKNFFNFCDYERVLIDRYKNRYEMVSLYTGNQTPNYRLRTYDYNNILLSDVSYNQTFDKQISTNTYGRYFINDAAGTNYFSPTIFSPSFQGFYGIWNSVIPSNVIINFDIDSLNNVWISTPAGLVAYNDLGVITSIKNMSSSSINVYPSPTTNLLNITSSEKISTIELISITGQILLLETINSKEHELQLQNFAEGIYFVKVIYVNGMSVTKKIVKQ